MRGNNLNILYTKKRPAIDTNNVVCVETGNLVEYKKKISGELHRVDGPARIERKESTLTYSTEENGEIFKHHTPSIVTRYEYRQHGKFKRPPSQESLPQIIIETHDQEGYLLKRTKRFLENGVMHNLYHPAETTLIFINNEEWAVWYIDGVTHSQDDYPAISAIRANKLLRQEWHKEGELHREKGPAWIEPSELKWFKEGKLHNDFGPAKAEFTEDKGWQFSYFVDGELQEKGKDIFMEEDLLELLGNSPVDLEKAAKLYF